jgi:cyclopropane fatty-acyl-phospholipid synthase-like methyltransferase
VSEDVKKYYRDRVLKAEFSSLLWQVGKTVSGVDVPDGQIEIIISAISNSLQLDVADKVLDIGSGNGLLTKKIATIVSSVTGVELTAELYDVAMQRSLGKNIKYLNMNIYDFLNVPQKLDFNKIYLYEVLQHFNYQKTDELFSALDSTCKSGTEIFVGGIPDLSKVWDFFNNRKRKSRYYSGLVSGKDPIGTWYHKNFFDCLAFKYGFQFEILDQQSDLYTSHYRYDCVFKKLK